MSVVQNASVPPASAASAPPRSALPWQVVAPTNQPAPPPSDSAADRWSTTIASIPYLSQARFSASKVVYQPPTVIQLSEATGCSVSELAGAYNDLPVIRLTKEVSNSTHADRTATETQTFDSFDYLQLVTIDDTLEMATNALRARRPVPDAEETFWEGDYWEKLKRVKEEQQQRKNLQRQRKRAQEGKNALNGASTNSVGLPSAHTLANTLSATNSPSFMTPHSRQGSLSGHAADADTSPNMANLPSAQRQKRIAKGLLRRARFNESQNSAHPTLRTTRSTSAQSQSSTSGPQPVVRCRTRPRSYSINSQLTDTRGFQYSISSAMSEGGRSVLSDSLRTPPLLPMSNPNPSQEQLVTSVDMDLSLSNGPTRSGATTQSRNSATNCGGRAATPQTSPQQEGTATVRLSTHGAPHQHAFAAHATSPLSCESKRSSPRLPAREEHSESTTLSWSPAPDAESTPVPRAVAPHAPLVTPSSSPSRTSPEAEKTPPTLSCRAPPPPLVLHGSGSSNPATVTFSVTQTSQPTQPTTAAAPLLLPAVEVQRSPVASASEGSGQLVTKPGPNSRCATARPSAKTKGNPRMAATRKAPPLSSAAAAATTAETKKAAPPSPPSTAASATALEQLKQNDTGAAARETREPQEPTPPAPPHLVGHPNVTMIPPPKKIHEAAVPRDTSAAIVQENQNADNAAVTVNGAAAAAKSDASSKPSPSSPTAPSNADRSSGLLAISPSPSLSTQGPSMQEASPAKSTTFTATPSGSATPRATATTVPPSRTPTREVSMSPRFERVVAVRSAATASTASTDVPQPAPQDGVATPAPPSGEGSSTRRRADDGAPRRAETPAGEASGSPPRRADAQARKPSTSSLGAKKSVPGTSGVGKGAVAPSDATVTAPPHRETRMHSPSRSTPAAAAAPATSDAAGAARSTPKASATAPTTARSTGAAGKEKQEKKSSNACCVAM